MKPSTRFFALLILVGLGLFLADNCYAAADALDTAISKTSEQKEKAKSLATVILSIASIICLGAIGWVVLVNRDTRVIITGLVSLVVAGVCGAVLVTL